MKKRTKDPKLSRCPLCGHQPLESRRRTERFWYGAGKERVEVEAQNVPVDVCPNPECGETFSGPEAAAVRHEAICRTLGILSPAQIKQLRQRLGKNRGEFALLTGIGVATLSRWEHGRLLPTRALDRYLRVLEENPGARLTLERLAGSPADGTERFPGLEITEEIQAAEKRFHDRHLGAPTVAEPEVAAKPSPILED